MEQFKKYLILADKDLNVKDCNQDFLHYIGMPGISSLELVIPPQDMMQLRNAVFAINPGEQGLICFRIRTQSGSLNWIAANVAKSNSLDGEIQIELSDIQHLKMSGNMAYYDKMTGLLNKQAITSYAQELTEEYPRRQFYFFLLDLDHFKAVNDTFGHMRGDEVIIDVAHIIRDCVGESGRVGRIGGDEFMLILEQPQTEEEMRTILGKIRDTVRETYRDFGENINLTVSIGGSHYPDYTTDYGELFKLADRMLYLAKIKGRDRYIFYTPAVHGPIRDEEKVVATSHRAAGENEKIRMMMDIMTQAVREKKITAEESIPSMIEMYNLDAVYLFEGEETTSSFGLERGAEDSAFREVTFSMPNLHSDAILTQIGKNQIAVINIYDISKQLYPDLIAYMDEQECRVMLVYHLKDSKRGGYLVYINRTDSACRLSEADLSDLTYFSHLFELYW